MNKDQVITRIKHNSMYRDDRETADYIIKALEQNTVSQKTYDNEYLARKQAEQKLYEIQQNTSDDCVSRQAMLDAITEIDGNINMDIYTNEVREIINELPPVTPKILTSDDCVSRADVFQMIKDMQDAGDCFIGYYTYDRVKNFPPVTPTHGACKDCSRNGTMRCKCFMWGGHEYMSYKNPNFYCADFEKECEKND